MRLILCFRFIFALVLVIVFDSRWPLYCRYDTDNFLIVSHKHLNDNWFFLTFGTKVVLKLGSKLYFLLAWS